MTADLDRLELELRSLPGVVAVGFERDANGEALVIQAVALSSTAPEDLHDRIRRVVDANLRHDARLEVVVDRVDG